MKEFQQKLECKYVKTTDDWYPCCEGNTVSVIIERREMKPYPKASKKNTYYCVRMQAAGNDDFAIDKIFFGSEGDANRVYNSWKEYIYDRIPEGVNQEWFYEHGFVCM